MEPNFLLLIGKEIYIKLI